MEATLEHVRNTPFDKDENAGSVFLIFLRLGLTSFGGPIAHLAAFRNEFVIRRRWFTERSYADLVSLCQFLPGPASSQVGISIGLFRKGYKGAISAWAGFTLPSAMFLIVFALGVSTLGDAVAQGPLHGLKIVAVAIVAQAVWGMAQNLCQGILRVMIMTIATCIALTMTSAWVQVGLIASAAVSGILLFKPVQNLPHDPISIPISHRAGFLWISLFFILLFGLPILSQLFPSKTIGLIDGFYRSGSLVFGGGHVVLPLLQAETVSNGLVSNEKFLAGYGAAQAMPGPLFTFAAFLGASLNTGASAWIGGLVGLLSIFAPSFLLLFGALPFWEKLRGNSRTQSALIGVNAAVVGLLLAALYNPVWVSAIKSGRDFSLALVAFVALVFGKLPPWAVVIACGFVGWLIS